jgi:hypothetical protein
MTLQQESLGEGYDESADPFVQNSQLKTQNIENIKKRDYKVGVQNLKFRSLCIAAYEMSICCD